MKKIKSIIILALVVIFVISFYIINKSDKNQTPHIIIPEFKIKNVRNDLFSIDLDLEIEDQNIPSSLPIYSIKESILTAAQATEFATKLGVSTEPFTTQDYKQNEVYVWSDVQNYLRISLTENIIDYKNNSTNIFNIQRTSLSDTELESKANEIIRQIGVLNQNNLKTDSIRYLHLDDDYKSYVEKSESNAIEVKLQQTTPSTYPIVSESYDAGMATTIFSNNGTLVSLYVDRINEVTEISNVPIKNQSEIMNSLNEAVVQSLNSGLIKYMEFLNTNIVSVTVKDIEIAYLHKSDNLYLYPIFVLSGYAVDNNQIEQEVVLYLSAMKK